MYKDRNERYGFLKKLCDEIGIDHFGICEVAQKIKNIRSAYYQKLKKKITQKNQERLQLIFINLKYCDL